MQVGLKAQSITYCALLLAGTSGLLSAILINQDFRHSVREMEQRALSHGELLSRTAEPLVLLNDTKELHELLQAACVDELHHARFLGADGKELTSHSTQTGFVPQASLDLRIPQVRVRAQAKQCIERTAQELAVVIPIHRLAEASDLSVDGQPSSQGSGVIGYVHLVYSLRQFRDTLANRVTISIVVTTIVIAAGTVLTVLLVRRLLRPIEHLASTASAIATGDLSRRAQEDTRGEIGVLARAFNHMADVVCSHAENLEQQVVERTAALADALHRAEAATVAKSEFLANMSHEIRTPMTAILGYCEILEDPSNAEQSQEYLQVVRRNGEHLLQIINDILDLSKIEAGKLEIEVVPFSCVQFISDIKSLMRVRADGKKLDFTIEFATPIPEKMESDPTRLRQILVNLIGNAIKFTETGGVTVVVHYGEQANEDLLTLCRDSHGTHEEVEHPPLRIGQPYLRFDVIDTGIGMNAEQVQRVFRPFAQADSSMARRFGGTGLGLSISRRLAEMLNGTILVSSQPQQGSTFHVIVSVNVPTKTRVIEKPDDSVVTGLGTPQFQLPPTGRSSIDCHVLLAEDGPDNQRLISWVLTHCGCKVTLANDGALAIDEVRRLAVSGERFDIILMDMQMPVMDGYTATRELRNMGYTGPIVALTAHAMSGDREKCLACGCTDYAIKPIDRTRLAEIVKAYSRSGQPA